MDAVSIADVFWFSVGVFAAFEIALGLNYVLLKFVLEAMKPATSDSAKALNGEMHSAQRLPQRD